MYDPEKPFSKRILEIISKTWNDQVIIEAGYPIIKNKRGYFIEHVDGTGTKGSLHWKNNSFNYAAVDAFAMNANDLAILGFQPKSLNCHLIMQEEREDVILCVVNKLTELCRKYDIIFTGGETAVLNTIEGMEIGIHMSGFTEEIINHPLKEGDLIYAHLSNGIHSNGLTLARKLLENTLDDYLIKELIKPTTIYLEDLDKTRLYAKKRMHITGGAFTKLRKIIGQTQDILIDFNSLEMPQIFKTLFQKLSEVTEDPSYEMLRNFNCGVGFVEVINPNDNEDFKSVSNKSILIGEIIRRGNGNIKIKSPFDDSFIVF
ncbi:MAG: AIR synthase-related protein [Candidatus Hodarchaeota archaeon]